MKLTIMHEQLSTALDTASRVAPKKPTLSILETSLLEATPDGGLQISGTDLRTRAWQTVPALVEEAGAVCLPPARIAAFLEAIPDGAEIKVAVDAAHKAVLSSGRTTVRIAGLDAEQFPPGRDISDAALDLTMPADILVGLISLTAHAAASEKAGRPVLTGLNLAFDGAVATMTSADGFRLAQATAEVPEGAECVSIIVPARPLADVARALKDATSARLVVDSGGGALQIESEAGCWSLSLIEGQFPDVLRVIPTDCPVAVTTSRSEMLRALRLVKGLEGNADGYRVHLAFSAGEIEVMAADRQEDHEARAIIDAEMIRGEPLQIALNTAYLTDAVEAIDGDGVLLELTGPDKACLIRSVRESAGCLQVVMPMNVAR